MTTIAQACELVGVSRSTLLYYERIGLVTPRRHPENGYRHYSEDEIHALLVIRQLQKAGFTLREAAAVMEGRLDPELMRSRFHALEQQIDDLRVALEMVKSLATLATGEPLASRSPSDPSGRWHAELEKTAGEAHAKWLRRLGFDEKAQLYIRWVTRNLNDPESYMQDFFAVFERMRRQGPGSPATTRRMFNRIPGRDRIAAILDIGCGKGQSSRVLADISRASITAVDNHQPFLDHLESEAAAANLGQRLRVLNKSMFALDFPPKRFDLVWSEGSAYLMGFRKALAQWRGLIRPGGYLLVSDLVWLTDRPPKACRELFEIEYPGMQDVATRLRQAGESGYEVVFDHIQDRQDWLDFYADMEACVQRAAVQRGMTQAYKRMTAEIEIGRKEGEAYGNLYLLLSPKT